MKKKSKEKEYLYGYLDYVMNRFDTEFSLIMKMNFLIFLMINSLKS